MKTCAFTGHRPDSFKFGYDENNALCMLLKEAVRRQIYALLDSGCTKFMSGCALGVDIWSAEAVIDIRRRHKEVELVGVVPFKGQESKWNNNDKERYNWILKSCNEVITLFDGYVRGAFYERDRYLVDNADVIIAVYDRNKFSSGTGYTVRYAMKKKKPIIIIDPETMDEEKYNF